jgi:GT2 family glycosyltransferase
VYKKNQGALYVVPSITIIHKSSRKARLATKPTIYMMTIYWFYLFFKNKFEGSVLNLLAFLLALSGDLMLHLGALIAQRKPKLEWWTIVYLLGSYITAFRHLKKILVGKLGFFNDTL